MFQNVILLCVMFSSIVVVFYSTWQLFMISMSYFNFCRFFYVVFFGSFFFLLSFLFF
jgi:hypothetical protein